MDNQALAYDGEPEDEGVSTAAEPETGGATAADVRERPVPSITIEAFVELEATRSLLERAGADRRLKRAHLSTMTGGLVEAIEQYHNKPSADLIIIETGMRGPALFEQLESLAAVCDEGSKLVIIGVANDISLYRGLIRRGVSEYLIPPLTPVQLIRTIGEIYDDPSEPYHGKVVAFVPAKGGCGSSTIAHNTAWCMAESLGVDTAIVDFDLSFGTASLSFNQDPMQGVAEALSEPERVDDVLLDRLITRCTDHLSLFSAPASVDRDWRMPPESFEAVVEAIRRTTPMLVIDLPHMWSQWVKQLALDADEVVITATPELASLRNAKNLFDLLKGARPNDAAPRVVLNQVDMPKRPEIPVADFVEALGTKPEVVLPFDANLFGSASNNGQMTSELKADAAPSEAFRQLAASVAGRQPAQAKTSIIRRLFQRS